MGKDPLHGGGHFLHHFGVRRSAAAATVGKDKVKGRVGIQGPLQGGITGELQWAEDGDG